MAPKHRKLQWDEIVEWAMKGLTSLLFMIGLHYANDMRSSVQGMQQSVEELNTKMAVVIEHRAWQDNEIHDLKNDIHDIKNQLYVLHRRGR
jgi:hypothetical protein